LACGSVSSSRQQRCAALRSRQSFSASQVLRHVSHDLSRRRLLPTCQRSSRRFAAPRSVRAVSCRSRLVMKISTESHVRITDCTHTDSAVSDASYLECDVGQQTYTVPATHISRWAAPPSRLETVDKTEQQTGLEPGHVSVPTGHPQLVCRHAAELKKIAARPVRYRSVDTVLGVTSGSSCSLLSASSRASASSSSSESSSSSNSCIEGARSQHTRHHRCSLMIHTVW